MSVNISRLSVLLTASAEGFDAVLEHSAHNVETFGERAKQGFELAAGALAAFGLEVGIHEAIDSIAESFERIEHVQRLASGLGVTTQAMSELAFTAKIAHVDIDDLSGAMVKMQRALNNAEGTARGTSAAFDALHVNVDAIARLPADQQLRKIADAMRDTHDVSARNAAALQIFGRGAASLLPLLNEGAEGLDKWAAEARKTGNAFNDLDASKVAEASEKTREAMSLVQGALNQLAITTAPYIAAVSSKLLDMGTNGTNVSHSLSRGFELVAQGGAYLADSVSVIEAAWHGLRAAIIEGVANATEKLAILASAFDDLLKKLHKKPTGIGESLGLMSADLHSQATEEATKMVDAWHDATSGANHKKVTQFFDDIKKSADEAAKSLSHPSLDSSAWEANAKILEQAYNKLDELKKAAEQVNMNSIEKTVDDIRRLGNALNPIPEAILKQAAAYKQAEESAKAFHEAQQKMLDEAHAAWEEARSPVQKYQDEVGKLKNLLSQGLISEDAEKILELKKFQALAGELSSQASFHPASMIEAGSQSAAHLTAQIDAQQRGADHVREMIKEQKSTNDYLRQLVDAAKIPPAVAAIVDF